MSLSFELAAAWGVVAYDCALAVFHILFWRLFGWPARLEPSGKVNAAITQTLNVMLTYVFVAYAATIAWQLRSGAEPPAVPLAIGAGFWLLRAALQPGLFRLRPSTNLGLTLLWLFGSALHGAAALGAS